MTSLLKIEQNIAVITLDAGKVNAVNEPLLDAINSQLDEAEKLAKVVILYGGERKFCGGFDLGVMQDSDETARNRLVRRGGELIRRLYSLPLPLVIAGDGHGIALGALIMLTGDYRIGVSEAKYGLNETAIGMVLPNWGLALARDRLAPTAMTEAIILSRIYSGQEAKIAGFLDLVVAHGATMETALQVAQKLSLLPGETFSEVKQKVREEALRNMQI